LIDPGRADRCFLSDPMEKAIELGGTLSEEAQATVNRLHLILRPFILRRLKAEVETQLPGKFEHVIYCDLSKRQRYLYDEYMSRTSTRESLTTGGYLGVANCLMQLRKVCNHPDLFEVRAIRTSFSMDRSIAGEQEPIYTRLNRLLPVPSADSRIGRDFVISTWAPASDMAAASCSRLDASDLLPSIQPAISNPHQDVRTIAGWKAFRAHHNASALADRWRRIKSINRSRCSTTPALSRELLSSVRQLGKSRWSDWAVASTDLPGGLFQSPWKTGPEQDGLGPFCRYDTRRCSQRSFWVLAAKTNQRMSSRTTAIIRQPAHNGSQTSDRFPGSLASSARLRKTTGTLYPAKGLEVRRTPCAYLHSDDKNAGHFGNLPQP
jgi:hypothetical protein